MIDSVGRTIDYLRVSLTDRCNLRCIYCMPEQGIELQPRESILRFYEVTRIIEAFSTLGIKKVRFTGGEPLILKGIEELIHETNKLQGIEDISITTNGILLFDMAEKLKRAGLKRVNISLDSLREDRYRQITRGGDIHKVFKAIERCLEIGITPIKLNVVLIKGINDDEIIDFINLTKERPIEVRFIELMPMGQGRELFEKGYISYEEVLKGFPELKPLPKGEHQVASLYKLPNSKGTVGFITPMSCKFCNGCNRIRLTASGTIKPCLHSEEEIDIKGLINQKDLLLQAIKSAIYNKPLEHHLDEEGESKSLRPMYQIGG